MTKLRYDDDDYTIEVGEAVRAELYAMGISRWTD